MERLKYLTLACIAFISACADESLGLNETRLPPIHSSVSDCEPLSFEPSLSIATWVGSANDVIEGTVVDVRAAWTPLVSQQGLIEDPTQCGRILPALDLVLTDVVSRRDGKEIGELTVRLGSGTLLLWDRQLFAEPGSSNISWDRSPPPLEPGMRVGGAIYHHVHVGLPVMMTGRHQPLYEVVDGTVHFQGQHEWECSMPFPDVAAMNGMTPEALGALLEATFDDAADNTDAEEFRAWLGVDEPTFNSTDGFSYGAFCYDVSDVD